MLPTLRLKLILAFGAAVFITVALTSLGSFWLLRQEQIRTERERVGLLVLHTYAEVVALAQLGASTEDLHQYLVGSAADRKVRFLLVDAQNRVAVDTQNELVGQNFDPSQRRLRFNDSSRGFSIATVEDGPEKQTIFSPVYGTRTVPVPVRRQYDLYLFVPEENITGAWRALIPKLIWPSLLALFVSGVIAYLLSRSIAGPVASVTHASEAMARGQYDQRIPVEGRDEIGRLATSFNAMAAQVSRSHRMMRDLLANVAHELKTPLTSIQGFSQALIEGAARTPEDQAKSARIINDEAERMRRLVEDLLYLSQLESGQLRMEMGRVDVPVLLSDAAERVSWQLRDSERRLRLNVAPGLPAIEGDTRRLEQVLGNLLDNAIRHTPAGGTVTLQGEQRDGTVVLSVHNTGSYIPPEVLSRVFERFYRADSHRSRDGRHGGLGLSIAAEIVAAHHGRIEVTSDQETGTEFRVTLPARIEAAAADATKQGGLAARLLSRGAPSPGPSPATRERGA